MCIDDYATQFNLNFNDRKTRKSFTHLEVLGLLRYIYNHLFKPDRTLCNNQASVIDYNNNDLLFVIAQKYIDICLFFEVSLGVSGFGYLTGIAQSTLWEWTEKQEVANPTRSKLIKNIRGFEQDTHELLLKQDPMGRVALANHSKKLGLNWEEQNRQQITNNQIYLLSSEKAQSLNLRALQGDSTKALETVEE